VTAAKRIGHVSVNGAVYTVTQGGCGTACSSTPPPVVPPPVTPPPAPSSTLRVLQYNTHHGGWSSAATPTYDPNRIVDWVMKANPDVISMNELEVGDSRSKGLDQSEVYKSLLEQRTGVTWYKVFVNAHGATTGIGNAVFSKYPFIATASTLLTGGRAAVDATISVNGRNVNVTSVHMDNVTQSNRLTETRELIAWQTTFAEERIVCGDWNAWPGATELENMQLTYIETWSAGKAAGTATGSGITHGSHQIDYIFLSKGAAHTTLKSVQTFNTADASGISPSDHQPILAVFEVQ
jgi:endonuclease/exonuclease/phosphatase family metal-dependent hydrolase